MQVQKTSISDTRIKLTLTADQSEIDEAKRQAIKSLGKEVKLPGFRAGKAPSEILEKSINPQTLQDQFLDNILNALYTESLTEYKLRPVSQPQVSIKKFVPFTTLEFEAEVEIIGEVTLPDYKKIKLAKPAISVTATDVTDVIENLRLRTAEKREVDRAAKNKDEVWIDFEGRDAKTGDPIQGADGKQYPLALGSNSFIPGFEENLVGVKPGETKEFTLSFPKDYGVKALQNRKVAFKVTVTKVTEVELPKVDDAFASKAGPFKTLAELKTDIKKQITADRQFKADRDYESELLAKITEKSKVPVPDSLIEEELQRLEQEERQNILYRGQTWEEHLASEGVTDEEHKANNRPGAEMRVKAGLVLAEIADQEKVVITKEAFDRQLELLKGQYQDPKMQAELDKPENRRELASRMLSEETIARIVGYATAK